MRDNILSRLSLGLLFACLCTLFAGCNSGLNQLSEEDRNPYALKAKEMVQDRDFRGAAELYRKALRVNPELANIHLELGLLYDDKLGDPISAIYHYRQYLELKPDSPKRPLVENFIDRDADRVVFGVAQEPTFISGDTEDHFGVTPRLNRQAVKPGIIDDAVAGVRESRRQHGRVRMHPTCDFDESFAAVPTGVEAGNVGQKHLCRADVRCGLFTSNVLFARLESETQRGSSLGVDADPDESTGK